MPRRRATRVPPAETRAPRWHALLILLAVAAIYANSLAGPFVFDDRDTIVDNIQIEDLTDPRRVLTPPYETPVAGRPVANLTLAVNYALGQRDVLGYHIGNIALHLACGLVLCGFLRRTFRLPGLESALDGAGNGFALAVALIWTAHPLNSEVVDYLSQRTESLMALFYLLTLYCASRAMHSPGRARWQGLAIASSAIGMACKESMVTVPLMVVLYDSAFTFQSLGPALKSRWRFYAGLASTWIVLLMLVWSAPRGLSAGFAAHDAAPWTYLLNQCVMVVHYLKLAFWPQDLVLFYGWPRPLVLSQVWPQALVLLGLLALVIAAFRRFRSLAFFGAWFFLTLAPTSSVLPIATEVGAERRMYLPLVGVIAIAALAIARLVSRADVGAFRSRTMRPVVVATLAAIVIALGARTLARNGEYRSSLTLAETTVTRWPTPGGHSMLGMELAAAGRYGEAETHLRMASVEFPPAKYYLGVLLRETGRPDEAISQLNDYIRTQPPVLAQVRLAHQVLADIHGRLANALMSQRSFADAVEQYRALLNERPNDVAALGGLGIALTELRRYAEAEAAFRRAVELEPSNAHARGNLEHFLSVHKKQE